MRMSVMVSGWGGGKVVGKEHPSDIGPIGI